MKKWLARLVWIPLALVGLVFAIANRETVELSLWPLPWSATAPFYMILLATLLVGMIIGAVLTWLGGHHYRVEARQHSRASDRLQRQVAELKSAAAAAPPPAPPAPPATTPPAPATAVRVVPPPAPPTL